MVRWHYWLSGREFEQSPGDGEGAGEPGVLQSMGLYRIGHNLGTEQQEFPLASRKVSELASGETI